MELRLQGIEGVVFAFLSYSVVRIFSIEVAIMCYDGTRWCMLNCVSVTYCHTNLWLVPFVDRNLSKSYSVLSGYLQVNCETFFSQDVLVLQPKQALYEWQHAITTPPWKTVAFKTAVRWWYQHVSLPKLLSKVIDSDSQSEIYDNSDNSM